MPYTSSTQPSLPYQSGSETSYQAALKASKFVGEQGLKVLAWAQAMGAHGVTQKECERAIGIGRPSACARFHALEKAGQLVKTDLRRSGCAVYRVGDGR